MGGGVGCGWGRQAPLWRGRRRESERAREWGEGGRGEGGEAKEREGKRGAPRWRGRRGEGGRRVRERGRGRAGGEHLGGGEDGEEREAHRRRRQLPDRVVRHLTPPPAPNTHTHVDTGTSFGPAAGPFPNSLAPSSGKVGVRAPSAAHASAQGDQLLTCHLLQWPSARTHQQAYPSDCRRVCVDRL